MRKRTTGIFITTFALLAFTAMLGNKDNTAKTDNVISDKLLAEVTEADEAGYEVSIETIKQDMLAGTMLGTPDDVSEAPTELQTEAVTEPQTEAVTEPQTEAVTEPQTEAVTEPQTEAVTEPQTEAPIEAPTEPQTEAPVEAPPAPVNWKYLYVGDSRTKGLEAALIKYGMRQQNQTFISEIGEGYNFLVANMDKIRSLCDSSTVLIVALGINDMKFRYNEYIAAINNMAATMDCRIYFMLVNPVNEAEEAANGKFHITNADIDQFNVRMMSGLSPAIGIIDTNSYLKNVIVNYTTMDGLHYTDETYITVYNYMVNFLPYS